MNGQSPRGFSPEGESGLIRLTKRSANALYLRRNLRAEWGIQLGDTVSPCVSPCVSSFSAWLRHSKVEKLAARLLTLTGFVRPFGPLPSTPGLCKAAQADRGRAAASLIRRSSHRPRPSNAVNAGPPQFRLCACSLPISRKAL
jgi:hypothetical protein